MGKTRTVSILLCAALGAVLMACGDDDETFDAASDAEVLFDGPVALDAGAPDARELDAVPLPDAAPDAEELPVLSGSLILLESAFAGPYAAAGQGVIASIDFSAPTKAPVFVSGDPGNGAGCVVMEYDLSTDTLPVQLDGGTLEFTAADGMPATGPCGFVAPLQSYMCVAGAGAGGTISSTGNPSGWFFTVANPSFTEADYGRYLVIDGALEPANNGAFPIMMYVDSTTVMIGNEAGVAEELPGAATWMSLSGAGPIPGTEDPGFLENDDAITVALQGANDWPSFSTSVEAGDDFAMDAASEAAMNDVPVDGSAYTVGCDSANNGCGTALLTVFNVETTDGDLSAVSPFDMPPPVNKAVQIQCFFIMASSVTVPAEAMAYIQNSGATRIRSHFLRVNMSSAAIGDATHEYTVVAGHSMMGYTNP